MAKTKVPTKKTVEPFEIERQYAIDLFKAMGVKGAAKQKNEWMSESLNALADKLDDDELAELEETDITAHEVATNILEALSKGQNIVVIDDEAGVEEDEEEETETEEESEDEETEDEETEDDGDDDSEDDQSESDDSEESEDEETEDEESETEDEEEETEDETEDEDDSESETEDDEETEEVEDEDSEDDSSDDSDDSEDDESEDEEEEEVEEAPKKKAKPVAAAKKAAPAAKKPAPVAKKDDKKAKPAAKKDEKKKPGVIHKIIQMLLSASKTKPIKKATILKELVKTFKDREERAMSSTLSAQVPTGLKTEKGIEVAAVKLKDDSIGYYIKSMGGYKLPTFS